MNSISIISTLAMAVGLAAALPQILQMLTTRSAAGQSVLGWGMGLVTNLSMAYVNLFGFDAKALMASNVLSAALCVIAMVLIVRFGPEQEQMLGTLIEMPTTEFAALREVVMQVDAARLQGTDVARERELVAA